MRRDAFMKELEYLLQDIPDEDKADAIAYYQDYLEEAGPENEEKVIQDFGSPERVAAIIRADICGNLEDGGEFTEKGYEDERFREPNFQLVKRQESPEDDAEGKNPGEEAECGYGTGSGGAAGNGYGAENGGTAGNGYGAGGGAAGNGYGTGNPGRAGSRGNAQTADMNGNYGNGVYADKSAAGQERGRWEWWQILGMIVLGCCIVPVVVPLIFGIGGGAIGLFLGLFGLLVAIIVAVSLGLAAVTAALLLAGIVLVIIAFGQMSMDMLQGILCLGTGVGIFGIGLLCLALCGLYYGIFLPWLVKSIINLISRLIHRKEAAA